MPVRGNDGLKLQEKGGSGPNSAPAFNRRIVQSKELLFPAKFLFSFVDFKSFKGRKKKKKKKGEKGVSITDITNSSGRRVGCRLLGGGDLALERFSGASQGSQCPRQSWDGDPRARSGL